MYTILLPWSISSLTATTSKLCITTVSYFVFRPPQATVTSPSRALHHLTLYVTIYKQHFAVHYVINSRQNYMQWYIQYPLWLCLSNATSLSESFPHCWRKMVVTKQYKTTIMRHTIYSILFFILFCFIFRSIILLFRALHRITLHIIISIQNHYSTMHCSIISY